MDLKKIHFKKVKMESMFCLFLCTSLQMPHLTFIAICMHSFENVCIIKEAHIVDSLGQEQKKIM